MPTVLRIGGARVVIYPNDHGPAHVHVIDGDKHARIALPEEVLNDHPRVLEAHGFSTRETGRILEAIAADASALRERWRQIHG